MFLYLDSSALVKRYVDEPLSETARPLMDEAPAAATALMTHPPRGLSAPPVSWQSVRTLRNDIAADLSPGPMLLRMTGLMW